MEGIAMRLLCWSIAVLLLGSASVALAQEAEKPAERKVTAAVLGFATDKKLGPEMGENLSVLLTAYLSMETEVPLVEREDLDKAMGEMGLGLSGMASANDAVKVGQLVGANVLITGRAFRLNDDMTIAVKIIGAETGRVFARVVKSEDPDDLDMVIMDLAATVGAVLDENRKSFLTPTNDELARVARIKAALADLKKPRVTVFIREEHRADQIIDPAAESEVNYYLGESGFKLADKDVKLKKGWAKYFKDEGLDGDIPKDLAAKCQVVVVGEAVSEFGTRRGNLISCKARVEMRAVDTETGELIATARATEAGVDVAESTAAKTAIQNATVSVLEKFIVDFTKRWDEAQ
jgi:hypothetical protein